MAWYLTTVTTLPYIKWTGKWSEQTEWEA